MKGALTPGPRFFSEGGIPVFLEASHTLPVVDLEVVFRRGGRTDPRGSDGLTRLTAGLMRRGPKGMSADRFDERLDALGSSLAITVSAETVRVHGAVLRRNLGELLELVGRILVEPAMRPSDFARLRRKTQAELVSLRDHDRSLAARAFRQKLFGAHPYGRPIAGTLASIPTIRLEDVIAHRERLVRTGNLMIGVAGDVTEQDLRPLVESAFGRIPRGRLTPQRPQTPKPKKGRRILVVDKPQRTQTQLYVGTLGVRMTDPEFFPLLVANTGFGGTFTSRLVKEVRSERGWSYGVGSKLGADRDPDAWTIWSHPGAEQLVDCLALELELFETWIARGLSKAEVARSKRYIVKSHAFERETPTKRLDPQLDTELYGLPRDLHAQFERHISAVTHASANEAVARHLSSRDVTITLVASVDDALLSRLRSLPGVSTVETISFTDV